MASLRKRLHSGHLTGPAYVRVGHWAIVRAPEGSWKDVNNPYRTDAMCRLHIVAATSQAALYMLMDHKKSHGAGTVTGLALSLVQQGDAWVMGYRIPGKRGRRLARALICELDVHLLENESAAFEWPRHIESLRELYG